MRDATTSAVNEPELEEEGIEAVCLARGDWQAVIDTATEVRIWRGVLLIQRGRPVRQVRRSMTYGEGIYELWWLEQVNTPTG